jgi:hypothetical protein
MRIAEPALHRRLIAFLAKYPAIFQERSVGSFSRLAIACRQ